MDEHFRQVELNIPIELFHRLPRNAAYKYEYFDGRAVLTPRPKFFTCVLDLPGEPLPDPLRMVDIRPLPIAELPKLTDLFIGSVRRTQPFESLENDDAKRAAIATYEKTLTGGDGPIIEPACFQALETRNGSLAGGFVVTLVPDEVRTEPFAGMWKEPPPPDAIARRLGCPHLTWVFVHPWMSRRGIATAMLAAAIPALMGLGFRDLASTFALDNGPSALWHWRNGFRLLPQWSLAMRQS